MSFIVLGTGRCGTVSISRILNGCGNVTTRHETPDFFIHWYQENVTENKSFKALITYLQNTNDGINKGEVALFYLPHWKEIKQSIPEIKFICLHRPKDEFIRSILKKTLVYMKEFSDQPFYMPHCLPYEKRNPKVQNRWCELMPKFQEANTVEQSWSMYWDMYEIESKRIPNCFHMNTEDLNNDEKLKELFTFLEIPEENWVFPEKRKYNESK